MVLLVVSFMQIFLMRVQRVNLSSKVVLCCQRIISCSLSAGQAVFCLTQCTLGFFQGPIPAIHQPLIPRYLFARVLDLSFQRSYLGAAFGVLASL